MAFSSTFSVAALDPSTGECGIAVASKYLAVGGAVPWVRAGAGAVATQSWVNLGYGPEGLRLLAEGRSAEDVVRILTAADSQREVRQLGVVDYRGGSAAWTGRECLDWAGHRLGPGYAIQGNILAGEGVVSAMETSFLSEGRPLWERLLAALEAGQQAGGDRRGQQAAALYMARVGGSYDGLIDRAIDLRVDDHPAPLVELRKLVRLHFLYLGATDPANLTPVDDRLARELQSTLGRLGFYRGEPSGRYDAATKAAFREFCLIENLEGRWNDGDMVDREILDFLRSNFDDRP